MENNKVKEVNVDNVIPFKYPVKVKEITYDIVDCMSVNNVEGLGKIVDKLSPKLKEGILQYLDGCINHLEYNPVPKWVKETEDELKARIIMFKMTRELVHFYPDYFTSECVASTYPLLLSLTRIRRKEKGTK